MVIVAAHTRVCVCVFIYMFILVCMYRCTCTYMQRLEDVNGCLP